MPRGSAFEQVQGELYDLKNDPHEWTNLYADARYAAVREQMKTELLMHLAYALSRNPLGTEDSHADSRPAPATSKKDSP